MKTSSILVVAALALWFAVDQAEAQVITTHRHTVAYTPVVTAYYAPTVAAYPATTAYYAPTTTYYAPAVQPVTAYYPATTTYYAPTTTYYAPTTTYYAPAAVASPTWVYYPNRIFPRRRWVVGYPY